MGMKGYPFQSVCGRMYLAFAAILCEVYFEGDLRGSFHVSS